MNRRQKKKFIKKHFVKSYRCVRFENTLINYYSYVYRPMEDPVSNKLFHIFKDALKDTKIPCNLISNLNDTYTNLVILKENEND